MRSIDPPKAEARNFHTWGRVDVRPPENAFLISVDGPARGLGIRFSSVLRPASFCRTDPAAWVDAATAASLRFACPSRRSHLRHTSWLG
jgi:hypothetical protein